MNSLSKLAVMILLSFMVCIYANAHEDGNYKLKINLTSTIADGDGVVNEPSGRPEYPPPNGSNGPKHPPYH